MFNAPPRCRSWVRFPFLFTKDSSVGRATTPSAGSNPVTNNDRVTQR